MRRKIEINTYIKTSLVGLAALLDVVGLAFLFIFSPGDDIIVIIEN